MNPSVNTFSWEKIRSFIKRLQVLSVCLLVLTFCFSCGPSAEKKAADDHRLSEIGNRINDDFSKIRVEVSKLAEFTVSLYIPKTMVQHASRVDPAGYKLHDNGVFYKPVDDGKSAVFVSGVVPVSKEIRKIVYGTEPLESRLMEVVKKYPEVVQSYYNDKNSYNRIYPYFDVITQYEPKMDIPKYNFYYLADGEHNPEKSAVWVKEPYVDPAGRGWMVSAIAPVYVDGELEGVPGLDVTINTITDRYIDRETGNLVLLDASATVVSIQDHLTMLLSLPPLENHKYLETIRSDTYRTDDYNLLKSRSRQVRKMAQRIFQENQTEVTFQNAGKTLRVTSVNIPELDWKLLQIIY
ncbi:hypothetical protein DO021_18375 [Desulfobacter hydrogenophilus]|uniref:Cache domain-containing protein n=1 Tax=Desulfobacter hydrogenophilus TaxID=2291 RepID=A0A328FBP0_9BACT|nr:hypothetical protein [Desulfobacter hydrogenophilus]NDY73677.1 hypothetical protein [Desulfobacter hydrogenophilus]QBH11768.1 hypothetical protein EYB58_01795 [Desulfobacter hydrogenophilus]RAM00545.1 hypothetical protein DO021_18375 [Desulfobacter hydrogenophilus]